MSRPRYDRLRVAVRDMLQSDSRMTLRSARSRRERGTLIHLGESGMVYSASLALAYSHSAGLWFRKKRAEVAQMQMAASSPVVEIFTLTPRGQVRHTLTEDIRSRFTAEHRVLKLRRQILKHHLRRLRRLARFLDSRRTFVSILSTCPKSFVMSNSWKVEAFEDWRTLPGDSSEPWPMGLAGGMRVTPIIFSATV